MIDNPNCLFRSKYISSAMRNHVGIIGLGEILRFDELGYAVEHGPEGQVF